MSFVQIPLRLTAGAFVLNSGLGKAKLTDEQAEGLRDAGSAGVPFVQKMSPRNFRRALTATEVGVGAALLLPIVPGWLAGSALSAFSASLLAMYLNTPEMTQEDGIRPSSEGTSVAKDFIMLGSGVGIVADSLLNNAGQKRKANAKRVKKIQDARDEKVEAIDDARQRFKDDRQQALKDQRQLVKDASKTARDGAKKIAKSLNIGK